MTYMAEKRGIYSLEEKNNLIGRLIEEQKKQNKIKERVK